ncbi:hypothetical protein [Microseira wollei]|uniref:hypothetical protein n=1 Tax=Microseira wollei TaxID=467598 RepID=UPI001CFE0F6C|nr:hypothetical protein [Microseira wollei]
MAANYAIVKGQTFYYSIAIGLSAAAEFCLDLASFLNQDIVDHLLARLPFRAYYS